MADVRKAARISTDLKIISRNSGNSIDSRIMNMSSGGVFVKTGHLLPVDAEFSLSLQLPEDPEIMAIDGRVVWTKTVSNASPSGMGIQFIAISPDYEKKITDFVKRNSEREIDNEPVKLYF
jgi:uncharacterized protein (TIGR02266 family)